MTVLQWYGLVISVRSSTEPQPLPHHPLHLSPVGSALGLAHHGADDRSHRLARARPNLLDRVGVLLDRPVDDRLELVGGGEAEAALLDDRRRAPALGRQRVE